MNPGITVVPALHINQQPAFTVNKANSILHYIGREHHPADPGKLFIHHFWGHTWHPVPHFVPPEFKKGVEKLEGFQDRATNMVMNLEDDLQGEAETAQLIWSDKEAAMVDPTAAYHCLSSNLDNWEGNRAKCFTVVEKDVTRDNRCKLKFGRFAMDIRKKFLTRKVVQCWNRRQRHAGISTLGNTQDVVRQCRGRPDLVQWQVCFKEEAGSDDLKMSLPTNTLWIYCTSSHLELVTTYACRKKIIAKYNCKYSAS